MSGCDDARKSICLIFVEEQNKNTFVCLSVHFVYFVVKKITTKDHKG